MSFRFFDAMKFSHRGPGGVAGYERMASSAEPPEAASSLVSGWLLLMLAIAIGVAALQRYSLRVDLVREDFYSVVRTDNWTGDYDVVPILGNHVEFDTLTLQEVMTLKLGAWVDRPAALYRAEPGPAPAIEFREAWTQCIAECQDDYESCARLCDRLPPK